MKEGIRTHIFFFNIYFKKILTDDTNIYVHTSFNNSRILLVEEEIVYTQLEWLTDGTDVGVCGSASHFLDNLACLFLGGAHFKHMVSTVIGGFLYWALFRCSSTSLGVTQITC